MKKTVFMKMKYRELRTEEEANKWIINNYYNFIIKNQQDINTKNTLGHALFCYTGSMSKYYNNLMHNAEAKIEQIKLPEDIFGDTIFNIESINSAFNLNEIKEDIVMYHYIRANPKELINYIHNNNNLINLKKFISTSLLKNCDGIKKLRKQNNYNILFKINVQKGTKCIPILWKKEQTCLSEYEVILRPTINLKLIRMKRKAFSKIEYEFEFYIV